MTVESKLPPISKVAIIGAGVGGLSTAYDFIHTNKNGFNRHFLNSSFKDIVIFEQQEDVGGIWNTKIDTPDLPLPPSTFFSNETYHKADEIHPNKLQNISSDVVEKIQNATVDSPVVLKRQDTDGSLQWSKSAVYDGLFTNVPKKFLSLSSFDNQHIFEKSTSFEEKIEPLVKHNKLETLVKQFAEAHQLKRLIRFSSEIELAEKKDGKWQLVVCHKKSESENEWYSETFDAVVVAVGHYSVPFIPKIEGLGQYCLKYPSKVMHNKSWRNPAGEKDKTVLFVGGSLSSLDILQYVYPVARKTYISRRNYGTSLKKPAAFPWLDTAADSSGIVNKPGIKKFDAQTGSIEFADGSVADDIDKVIFCTGYHTHFPFLNSTSGISFSVEDNLDNPSSTSRVKGLYQHIFSISDPTLAFVGLKVASLKWMTLELSGAVVAGIWSGSRQLPSKKEQQEWEEEAVKKKGDNMGFHYSDWKNIKEEFADQVGPFLAEGRRNPFDKYDNRDIDEEMECTQQVLEETFFKFKDGIINFEESL